MQALLDAVSRGRKMASKPDLQPGMVKIWFGIARNALRKMFGSDSTVITLWPTPSDPLGKDEALPAILVRLAQLEQLISSLNGVAETALSPAHGKKIFIGHGRSPVWRELKDFLSDRLNLPWGEFNRESVAGISTTEPLCCSLRQNKFCAIEQRISRQCISLRWIFGMTWNISGNSEKQSCRAKRF